MMIYSWIMSRTTQEGEKMKAKAYAYLRVSSQGQVEGNGFDRQEDAIREYIKKAGLELEGVFREEGVSGTADKDERPAFQDMMTAILKNGVRTVIVERLDRLAREYRIQETLLIYLASKGVDLISASTEENVTEAIQADPMKKALIQMQGIFAELEKSLLVKKLRLSRERVRKQTGKCEGRKRYGETEEEQAVIRRMRAMRRKGRTGAKGMTLKAVAEKLNSEGIHTKDGKQWTPTQVHRALKTKKR